MIHIRNNKDHKLVGTVIPARHVENMGDSPSDIEHRIALSFNILATIPLEELEKIADNPSPIDGLMRWLESRKVSH